MRAAGDWIDDAEETTAWCAKIKRRDGTVVAFTEHDKDLTFDIGDGDGSVTYDKDNVVNFSALSAYAQLGTLDDTTLSGAFQDGVITREDVRARLWNAATVTILRVNFQDTSDRILEMKGDTADWEVGDFEWQASVFGLKARLQKRIGDVIQQYCRAKFLSTEGRNSCGRPPLPDDWEPATEYELGDFVRAGTFDDRDYKCIQAGTSETSEPSFDTTVGNETEDGDVVWETFRAVRVTGSVSSVTDSLTLVLTGFNTGEYIDGWFGWGELDFTSGDNNGVKGIPVLGWVSATATLTLAEPPPFDVSPGDTFTLFAGCNKTKEEGVVNCKTHGQFGRVAPGKGGFRGEEGVPTISQKAEIVRSAGTGGKK